jgi:hypothetical protein
VSEHIVRLNAEAVSVLRRWLDNPEGCTTLSARILFEAKSDGGLYVHTYPAAGEAPVRPQLPSEVPVPPQPFKPRMRPLRADA